ncbi:hypothetical protein AMS68_001337 [Peltaster fructicola]|uniref:DUF7053 domain-containing protein n=1 Tax=Peltaster fructicola TaxID=286661 RepID=A0A6H0XMU8_9PEZI|nr:hypothetical protein AMS68_001337 [Peltaster fructicola]
MFETNFSYKSATPIPSTVSLKDALNILHDFETVNKLNPDVRGSKPIVPKSTPKRPAAASAKSIRGDTPLGEIQYFEVEDDLPFIPKRLWSGGVRYQADYVPTEQGCNITVHAPGGFTSVNYWRLVHDETGAVVGTSEEQEGSTEISQVKSRDIMHTESDSGAWHVQITSDARCNMTFATFVKAFLKNSHVQLQQAFIDKCIEMKDAPLKRREVGDPLSGEERAVSSKGILGSLLATILSMLQHDQIHSQMLFTSEDVNYHMLTMLHKLLQLARLSSRLQVRGL